MKALAGAALLLAALAAPPGWAHDGHDGYDPPEAAAALSAPEDPRPLAIGDFYVAASGPDWVSLLWEVPPEEAFYQVRACPGTGECAGDWEIVSPATDGVRAGWLVKMPGAAAGDVWRFEVRAGDIYDLGEPARTGFIFR